MRFETFLSHNKTNTMSKIEKKKERLKSQIEAYEKELTEALTKKTSNVKEINVAQHTQRIADLRKQLNSLK